MKAAQRTLVARDLMRKAPPSVAPSTGLERLASLIWRHHASGTLVVDEAGALIGTVAARHVMFLWRGLAAGRPASSTSAAGREPRGSTGRARAALFCAADLMTPGPTTVPPDTPISRVADLVLESGGRGVVVVTDSRGVPVGVITASALRGLLPRAARERPNRLSSYPRSAP